MNQEDQELRGLRFAFSATAEIAAASSPTAFVPARVTELSLRGCFLETSASLEMQRSVVVKIHNSGEYFEAEASVLYVRPSGVGVVFGEIKPPFRAILQKWVLAAMDNQPLAQQTPR
ncbi:MAG: PilZ domain-containing protein [Candidatus Acidiferrum sp.]